MFVRRRDLSCLSALVSVHTGARSSPVFILASSVIRPAMMMMMMIMMMMMMLTRMNSCLVSTSMMATLERSRLTTSACCRPTSHCNVRRSTSCVVPVNVNSCQSHSSSVMIVIVSVLLLVLLISVIEIVPVMYSFYPSMKS